MKALLKLALIIVVVLFAVEHGWLLAGAAAIGRIGREVVAVAMTGKFETCLRWEDIPHHWKVECGKQTEDYKRDILRETNQAAKDALGTAYGP